VRDLARAAAFAVALLLLGRGAAIAGGGATLVLGAVVLGLGLLGMLLGRDGLVTASGLGIAGQYVLALEHGDVAVDLAAPVVAALVVLYLDLGDLALAMPDDRRIDRAYLRSTLRHAGALVGIGTLAGLVTYGIAAVPWPGAEWLRAAGALGVAAVVLVPVLLLRRT
jgi:hypothetical protein